MKLQLVQTNESETPLIRLFDFTSAEAIELHNAIGPVTTGESVDVHELSFMQTFGDFHLTMILDERPRNPDRDFSIVPGPNQNAYLWRESQSGWQHVQSLLNPFSLRVDGMQYCWLTDDLGISVLLSPSGAW